MQKRTREKTPLTAAERLYGRIVHAPAPRHAAHLGPCWLYTGALNTRGYGLVTVRLGAKKHKAFYAHRLSWLLAFGEDLPPDIHAAHLCDVRRCVNPYHLFKTTVQGNQTDMKEKGRSTKGISYTHVPEEIADLIRVERAAGESVRTIARRHNRSVTTIEDICTWRRAGDKKRLAAGGPKLRALESRIAIARGRAAYDRLHDRSTLYRGTLDFGDWSGRPFGLDEGDSSELD